MYKLMVEARWQGQQHAPARYLGRSKVRDVPARADDRVADEIRCDKDGFFLCARKPEGIIAAAGDF